MGLRRPLRFSWVNVVSNSAVWDRPYIGLRYFKERDAHLFYGRDEHIGELLAKVAQNRFVAVMGSSGSGKSSLVRAGLLPELRSGMIPNAGSRWRVVEFQPGNAPLDQLATALNRELGIDDARQLVAEGPLGIVRAVAAASLEPGTNILLIADQFEEVFRFEREESAKGRGPKAAEECHALARRLLDATEEPASQIYVLLVMRSDYLGECAKFPDLPERMSKSLYLLPRLRRDQLHEAITAPAGGRIDGAVVQRLLQEAGSNPDQLPRLQHLLERMWDQAKGQQLTMDQYSIAGGWEKALEQHLEEVYDRLSEPDKIACGRVFRQLSEFDKGRAVRRRTDPSELFEVCGPNAAAVVNAFRAQGFLAPQPSPVDITHECILREWPRLGEWLEREQVDSKRLHELAEAALDAKWKLDLPAEEQESIRGLEGLTLSNLIDWRNKVSPTAAWARRYLAEADFQNADSYLTFSEVRDQRRQYRTRLERRLVICLLASALLIVGYFWWRSNKAYKAANNARIIAQGSLSALNEFKRQVLRQNGWSEERIENVSPDSPEVKRSLDANKDLLRLPKEASRLIIFYYPKAADPTVAFEVLEGYLNSFGYQLKRTPGQNGEPTNVLWFRNPVPIIDLKRIALSLIRAGVELRAIKELKTEGPRREVAVGYDPEYKSHPPWQPAEIVNIVNTEEFTSARRGINKAYVALDSPSLATQSKARDFLDARGIVYTRTLSPQNKVETIATTLSSTAEAIQLQRDMTAAGISCVVRYP
jgi:energy-coupling factor transporter ATP-binding protein EcfA2